MLTLLCLIGRVIYAQAPIAAFTSNVTQGCAPLGVSFKDQSTNNPTSWEWDFGNGSTSSSQNPGCTYSTPGTYTVTLIVKNASGANAVRMTNYITVNPSPTISFGSNIQLACVPGNIQFINYSTPGQGTIVSYNWNFGDGSSSNAAAPAHSYTQTGYFNVGLTATNSAGCSGSATYNRYIRVVAGIQPQFTWDQVSTSCTAPYSLNFTNQTAGPGTLTYNWTLGSGAAPATSTDVNPAGISYPSAGSYSVTLAVSSNLGCSGTLTQSVPVVAGVVAIKGPSAGCLNTPVTFSNTSTPAPTSSTWDFGDGSGTFTGNTTTHTYTTAGNYTVTLTSTSPTCTNTTTSTITIGSTFSPTFTASPTTGCKVPLAVQFTDQTTPLLTTYAWNFGDGSTSTQPNPSHTYTTAGSYTVTLSGTNTTGCTSTTTTMANLVQIVAPTITLSAVQGCVNTAVLPTATVTSVDGVASYAWSATGASSSSGTNTATPSFTFATQGTYPISLTITTTGGCTATQTVNAIIGTPVTPVTFTASPNPVCGNIPVTFTASYPVVDGYDYSWTFGDGSPPQKGSPVIHDYINFGTLTATLTLTNNGCPSNGTQTVTVNPGIPNFGYKVNCPANNYQVNFIDSSKTDAGPLTYVWDFGDGTPTYTATAAPYTPPTHSYAATGANVYNVTLTLTDGTSPNICTTTVTKPVTVTNFISSFTISTNPVCDNANFTLQSTSQQFPTGTPTTGYIWTIGTTIYHKANSFTTSLPTNGTYPITLTLTDVNGCTYTSPASNIVVTGPIANFTTSAGGCLNSPITFTSTSTPYPGPPVAPITSWNWNFGDGILSSVLTPGTTHNYADTGTFNPTLEVVDNAGCANVFDGPPIQITKPQAIFSDPYTYYCPSTPLTLLDSSKGYGPLTDTWNFGDGSVGTTNPHTFPAADSTYKVTLTVADKYGCLDTTTESVRIQAPIAAFQISDTTAICTPLETMFTAQPQYNDSLYWEFGDGSTSTLAVTSHFYNAYDTFYAKLVVQGAGGCLDSATRRVLLLNPNTTTTFTVNPLQACDSVVAQFTVVPPGYTSYTLTFGDGQTDNSTDSLFTHTYRNPNTYQPLITITDATGCIVQYVANGGGANSVIKVLGAVPFFSVSQQAFCDTGTVVFSDFTITNDPIISKTYTFGDGASASQSPPLTNPFDTTHFYSMPGNLLATLNVTTQHNCAENYTDTIHVWQTPHPQIATSGYLCAGIIQLLGSLVTPDIDSVTWNWNLGNGQSSAVQNPQVNYQGGTYQVSLTTSVAFGCSDTTSTSISINALPTIKGPAEINTPVGVPVTIPFTYSSGITTYAWTPTTNLSCADCANPSATLTFNQQYSVLVTDSNNCTNTASILIKTVCNDDNYFIPNTFSPNNDGVNDYFYPRGRSLYNIQSMRVFNRWGQLIFQRQNFPANSESMGWDGTFNGHPAPSDAYVYIVEVICDNAQVVALQGTVTLVR
jgi:gliding motility-associated-like protein